MCYIALVVALTPTCLSCRAGENEQRSCKAAEYKSLQLHFHYQTFPIGNIESKILAEKTLLLKTVKLIFFCESCINAKDPYIF